MKKCMLISFLSLVLLCALILPDISASAIPCVQIYIPITFSEIPVYIQELYRYSGTPGYGDYKYEYTDSYFPYPVLPISFTKGYTQYATEFREEYPQRYVSLEDHGWGGIQFLNRIYCDSEESDPYTCDFYDTYDYAAFATNTIWCKTVFMDRSWSKASLDLDYWDRWICWEEINPQQVKSDSEKEIYIATRQKTYKDKFNFEVATFQFIDDKYVIVIGLSADLEIGSFNGQVKNYYETLATRLAEGTTVLQIPLTAADSEIDAMIAAVDTDSFSNTVPDSVHYIPSTPKDPDEYHNRPSVDRWRNYPEELRPGYVPESSEDFGTSEEPSQEVSEEISDVTSDDVSAEESSYSPESTESVADTISAEESIESADSAVSADSTEDIDDESNNELTAVVITLGVIAVCGVLLFIIFKKKDNK